MVSRPSSHPARGEPPNGRPVFAWRVGAVIAWPIKGRDQVGAVCGGRVGSTVGRFASRGAAGRYPDSSCRMRPTAAMAPPAILSRSRSVGSKEVRTPEGLRRSRFERGRRIGSASSAHRRGRCYDCAGRRRQDSWKRCPRWCRRLALSFADHPEGTGNWRTPGRRCWKSRAVTTGSSSRSGRNFGSACRSWRK